MPRNNTNPVVGGESVPAFGWAGVNMKQLRGQVALGGAISAVATAGAIPANFMPFAAGLRCDLGGVTLTTAVRLGLGVASTDPDALCLSGTTMTAGSQTVQRCHSPGMIFANQVAGTAGGASSTAAATLTTFTGQTPTPIAANSLKPGDVIRIRGGGTIGWGTDGTAILKVLIGTDIVAQSATITPQDGDIFTFDVDVTIRTVGATGTFVATGRFYIGTASVVAGAADGPSGTYLGSTAVDTTAAISPSVTIIFSTSQAAHNGVLQAYSIEVIRPQTAYFGAAAAFPLVSCVSAAGIQAGTGTGNVTYSIWGMEFPALPTAVI